MPSSLLVKVSRVVKTRQEQQTNEASHPAAHLDCLPLKYELREQVKDAEGLTETGKAKVLLVTLHREDWRAAEVSVFFLQR